jgi:plastocyanin domain-containing protein
MGAAFNFERRSRIPRHTLACAFSFCSLCLSWLCLLLSLSGCKKADPGAPTADVVASEHGFSPASLKLTQGGPSSHAAVTFVRTTDKTCATEVVFPELNIERKLPLNQVVSVEVPTDTARTLTFQCGMAMYKGALVVTSK